MITYRKIITTAALLLLLITLLAGCSSTGGTPEYADNPIADEEVIVQISTIDAILSGVYDGVIDYGTLKGYGDFGIGTFEALDGEMIAFDGRYYQIKADGVARRVDDSMLTPFASVTFFDADFKATLTSDTTYEQLQDYFNETLPSDNLFYAIRIDGTFSYMKTRSVPGQQKPYSPLVEVTKNQPIFEFDNVEGTIAGFRCPEFVEGVNASGYHLHFLTKDRTAGGHILDFIASEATITVDYSSSFYMILPGEGSDFYDIALDEDKQEELEEAEK